MYNLLYYVSTLIFLSLSHNDNNNYKMEDKCDTARCFATISGDNRIEQSRLSNKQRGQRIRQEKGERKPLSAECS